MLGKQRQPDLDIPKILDGIEGAVYARTKPYGFRKHGRTLHRFVSGDISQVIHFQLGQAYRGETHLLVVNVGIRVPECMTRSFVPEESRKKYYQEYDCNIHSRLGEIQGKAATIYDLRRPVAAITRDILEQVQTPVLPAFEALSSREAILARRRDYPQFDLMSRHLILLEEAMIYGHLGDREEAAARFSQHYHLAEQRAADSKDAPAKQRHLRYLEGLAAELGVELD